MFKNGWYYVENGARVGPVERKELERLVAQGTVAAETLIWQEGMSDWEEAGRHFATTGEMDGPPPIPSAAHTEAGADTGRLYIGAPARSLDEAFRVCLIEKYNVFTGRASRSEFWYFFVFAVITSVMGASGEIVTQAIGLVFSVILLLPELAVGIRRFHDINRSGWWYGCFFVANQVLWLVAAVSDPGAMDALLGFAAVVLLIYWIVLMFFLCKKGDHGPNRFG